MRMGACLGLLRLPSPPILEPSFEMGRFVFFGFVFGNAFAQKTFFFLRGKTNILGSILGPKMGQSRGPFFHTFRYFRVHFWGPRLLRKPHFLHGKLDMLGFILGPKTRPFFAFSCTLQETNDGSDAKVLDLRFTVISKTSVSLRQN